MSQRVGMIRRVTILLLERRQAAFEKNCQAPSQVVSSEIVLLYLI